MRAVGCTRVSRSRSPRWRVGTPWRRDTLYPSMGGQRVDTRSSTGKLMLTMLGAIAAFEPDLMLDRQREGIAKAKAEGKYQGRVPTAQRQAGEARLLKAEGVHPLEIAKRLGISRASAYRLLAERRPD